MFRLKDQLTGTIRRLDVEVCLTLLLDALLAASGVEIDLWPFFDALEGLPTALIRGANSDLLTGETAAEMRRRRPDMIFAEVPDRAHIPYLDEPESLHVIHQFLDQL